MHGYAFVCEASDAEELEEARAFTTTSSIGAPPTPLGEANIVPSCECGALGRKKRLDTLANYIVFASIRNVAGRKCAPSARVFAKFSRLLTYF